MIPKQLFYLLFVVLCVKSTLAQQQPIEISYEIRGDNSVAFSYKKNSPGNYYLRIEFPRVENAHQNHYEQILNYDHGKLVTLRPIHRKRAIQFSYTYSFIRGIPNPNVDSLYHYVLPVEDSKTIRIKEASHVGEEYFAAEKPLNWTSYIINSRTPEAVHAMRRGLVVEVLDEHTKNTEQNKTYTSKRNHVLIEHKDGTYALYQGLDKETISVKNGDEVYPNTYLGKIQEFNNSLYRLDFSIYYLFNKEFENNKAKSLREKKSNNKYVQPYFLTEQGVIQIESGKEYTAEITDAIFTKEFSRREKRQFLKDPENFK